MSRPIPDALRVPVTDLESGKAWLRALVAADMSFHLEDDPGEIIMGRTNHRLFMKQDLPIIRAAVAQLYSFDWGRKPGEDFDQCPIGFMMDVELETGKREP